MECNKEEAIRAKGIAESKMQNKDFSGARKIVLKAQQLYPDLENISQMLTVCEVHCSAASKVNGETDWYGILQVEVTADEATIKKQYRKLALLLHPDKNKFAGAEAAFKLAGEAHRILSDRGKRSLHDMKRAVNYRTVQTRRPSQQSNRAAYVRNQTSVSSNVSNTTKVQFNGLNQNLHSSSSFSSAQTFWTICPNCNMRYQYYKNILNRPLRCQSCLTPFMAYDMNPQPVPPGMSSGFSCNGSGSGVQEQGFPGQQAPAAQQNAASTGFQENVDGGSAASESFFKSRFNSEAADGLTNKPKEEGKVSNKRDTSNEIKTEKVKLDKMRKREQTVKPPEAARWKRAGKAVVLSSDSENSDSDSDSDSEGSDREDIVIEEDDYSVQLNAGSHGTSYTRRSTRQKQNVSYNEHAGDDGDNDFANPPSSKRLRKGGLSHNIDQYEKFSGDAATGFNMQAGDTAISEGKKNGKEKRNALSDGNLPNGNIPINKNGMCSRGQEGKDEKHGFKPGTTSNAGPSVDTFSYPDPEFYDFENNRDPSQFATDQIWAVYDDLDGMPRFYARIRNVCSPEFKLRFTWLEHDPISKAEAAWSDQELPVACGNFRHGKTEYTQDRLMFSHLMSGDKGSKRNSYWICPRKGEVWALFKGWNIGWSSDAESHRDYDYEIVEVLSDVAEGSEISTAHLFKIKGFVSLFARAVDEGAPLRIPADEILKFSHKVPSYRLSGNEREGIPGDCFELDTASLPSNFNEIFPSISLHSATLKVERLDNGCIGLGSKSATGAEKSAAGTTKETVELNEKNARENKNTDRDCSPEGISGIHTQKHVGSHFMAPELHADEKLNTDAGKPIDNDSTENEDASSLNSPSTLCYEYPDPEFFNFVEERSSEKFQKDQIWALYSDVDGYPNYYGLIVKVQLDGFKVHLLWLEACPLREEETQWMEKGLPFGCGRFKVVHGMEVFDTTATFSHLVEARPSGRKDRYDIYPNKGDIWAVFKHWNVGWMRADLKNCEYDLVEVMNHTSSGLHVAVLTKVAGYSTVFMPQRKGGDLIVMDIPVNEFLRFSHRIPAFQLTEEKGGELQGFWELDPASVPDVLLYTD